MEKSVKNIKHAAENIWQNLRCWKWDGMWSSVFDTIYTQVHLFFSTETKTKEKKADYNYNIYTN